MVDKSIFNTKENINGKKSIRHVVSMNMIKVSLNQ